MNGIEKYKGRGQSGATLQDISGPFHLLLRWQTPDEQELAHDTIRPCPHHSTMCLSSRI